jgi:hypothetical protein
MTTTERILELKHENRPFTIHLSDGRAFRILGADWVSLHPSGRASNITVYGQGDEEEHHIPLFAITSVSVNGNV